MTFKKQFSTLFLFLFCLQLIAQSNYSDYSYSDKETILFDSFNDNDNNWSTYSNDNYTREIYDGDYFINNKKTSGTLTSLIPVNINENDNYEIEARISRVYGDKKSLLISLIWGGNNSNKNFFGFTGDKSYRISKYENSKYTAYKDWTDSSYLESESNLLTIRKVGSKMYFFINKRYVHNRYVKSFYGNEIGFQSPSSTKIKVSFLRVSKLKKNKKDYSSYSYKDKNTFFSEEFNNNHRDWSTGIKEKSYGDIYNGYYTWKSKSSTSAWSTQKTVVINQKKDFEIETRFKYLSGKKTSGIMVQWGKSYSSGNNFNFEVTQSGKYWIGKYYESEYIASKKWTASTSISKTSYNKLTIRKINLTYYFFINGTFVHTMPFKDFYGDKVAFSVPSSTGMRIDYLKISYLGEKVSNNVGEEKGGEETAPGGR